MYATLVKMCSETGRIVGHLSRGQLHLGRRFDWFCGMIPNIPGEEIKGSFLRLIAYALFIVASA